LSHSAFCSTLALTPISTPFPYTTLFRSLEEAYKGRVMEMLGARRAELADMTGAGTGRVRLEFTVPARGLLGFRREFLTETRGTGDRKSTRLNSSHVAISYAVFCLKKKKL